jgi:hypothetical protein
MPGPSVSDAPGILSNVHVSVSSAPGRAATAAGRTSWLLAPGRLADPGLLFGRQHLRELGGRFETPFGELRLQRRYLLRQLLDLRAIGRVGEQFEPQGTLRIPQLRDDGLGALARGRGELAHLRALFGGQVEIADAETEGPSRTQRGATESHRPPTDVGVTANGVAIPPVALQGFCSFGVKSNRTGREPEHGRK